MSFLPEPAHIANSSKRPLGCRPEEKCERLAGLALKLDLSGDLEWWLGGKRSEIRTPETGAHSSLIHKAPLSQGSLTCSHFPPFCYQKITEAKCLEVLSESGSVTLSEGHCQSVTTLIKQRPPDLCVGMVWFLLPGIPFSRGVRIFFLPQRNSHLSFCPSFSGISVHSTLQIKIIHC